MDLPKNERLIGYIECKRKGKSHSGSGEQSPCKIAITILNTEEGDKLVLRGVDENGVASIVAQMENYEARILKEIISEGINLVKE